MKLDYTLSGLSFAILAVLNLGAQPFHADTTVGGTQTLEVEGNLSVKQYGGGYGGDLRVVGEAHLAAGGQALSFVNPEASGVTGHFYGPVKIGVGTQVGEYVFEKTGDNTSGDFIVPLGRFGVYEGVTIQLDVLTGPYDADSGAAHFTIMGKRHRGTGDLTAVAHTAFGGGRGVKIRGWNFHGIAYLFLEFDGTGNTNDNYAHKVIVRATSSGEITPANRDGLLTEMTPIRLANSLVSDVFYGDDMTHTFNAGNIMLNGNVVIPAGKSLMVDGSPILTAATPPYASAAWNAAFVPRGNATNGAGLALGASSASGYNSISNGTASAQATGAYSFATGLSAISSGLGSYANGFWATASGGYARAHGFAVTAAAANSTAYGYQSKALGSYSTAIGYYIEANSFAETAFGSANLTGPAVPDTWDPMGYLFHVGNGAVPSERSDALTILKNGETTLTNKDWKTNYVANPSSALGDPASATDSGGEALVVEGHARLKGKVTIEVPQGDISMGIYE